MRGGRTPANLATLANGLVGVGAIAYTLAGNKLWAMLLIVCGLGFDGLDGWLSRRSGLPPSRFGRFADSISDAVTFGLAPGVLVAYHPEHVALWSPWTGTALAVGGVVAALAIARLVYFTWRGYARHDFLGAPTPQNALAVCAVALFLDVPAYVGTNPPVALLLWAALAVGMVAPIPFPKIRRGAPLRIPMTVTAIALVLGLLPIQFGPSPGSLLFDLAEGAAGLAAAGVATYYLAGPFTVREAPAAPPSTDG